MNLPSYFLADLPAEASLTPMMVTEACQTLKRNRVQFLVERPIASLVRTISTVAQEWRQPESPFLKLALDLGPSATGFSRETLAAGLDAMFASLTSEGLHALLHQDIGHPHRLERMTADELDAGSERAAMVRGPELLVHIAAGNLPNPVCMSMVLGLLTRSAQFVKCASGASLIPRLFAHSLHEIEPKLGACLEIAEWRGGNTSLEQALFAEADCVTATGSDETLAAIRHRIPARVRFLGYGHRVSFGYVASEVLGGMNPRKTVARAAEDVAAWNQLGCLSPHVIYVETGGVITPEQFAEMLAVELAHREAHEPRGPLGVEDAAAIASRRHFYEVRAAHSPDTRIWNSPGSTAWTVVYENDPMFQSSCLNRFVYVKAVSDLARALEGADAVRGRVSTVGLAATENRAHQIAVALAQWGVTRVCPLGRMQKPPLAWRHDGRPSLGDLVTWVDWEM